MTETASAPPSRGARWRRAVGVVVVLVVIAFGILALRGSWSDARTALDRLSAVDLIASAVPGAVALWLMYVAWRWFLAAVGGKLPTPDARAMFFTTQLGKYVPGSIWPALLQAEVGKRNNVPRARMLAGYALAFSGGIITGAVVGLLALDGPASGWVPVAALIGGLAGLVLTGMLLDGRPFGALMARLLRRREGRFARYAGLDFSHLDRAAILRAVIAIFGAWGALGLHTWLLARPLGASATDLPFVAGSFAFAWIAGMVAIPVPAGAGVREVVLVLTVGELLGRPEATVIALASRLVLLMLELGAAALAGAPRAWRGLRRPAVP
jgi:uncharacterized membrane protein YbhN (UPF0104 family)